MNEEQLLKALTITCFYEGYDDVFKKFVTVFKDKKEISYFDLHSECNEFDDFFWSILVLLYGNYGIAPRKGWITNVKGFLGFCQKVIDETKLPWEEEGGSDQ